MGRRARLIAAALALSPGPAVSQGGEVRGIISCGSGRQIEFSARSDDVVTRVTVDGRAAALPPGAPVRVGEMEAFCGPASPVDALAALRANAEANAAGPIRDAPSSAGVTTRTMDAALGAPRPHPLQTPGLPTAAVEAQDPDPDWEACAKAADPNGCRASLLDARSRDERGLLQTIGKAWRDDGAMGLLRLAHESWLLYGLLAVAVAVVFAVPRLIRRRG